MLDHRFIFIAGLHRSGTSLLHKILQAHPSISGFANTGVPEDEGQHLQNIYPTAKAFGGPGKFALDANAYMDENHPLATPENAQKLFQQWQPYYDLACPYLVEKSPPNLVRTRFLQALYPDSVFIVLLRHPLAVSYATQNRWGGEGIKASLEHVFHAYDIFHGDMKHLKNVYILKYEDFVIDPQNTLNEIFSRLALEPIASPYEVKTTINDAYFAQWQEAQKSLKDYFYFRLNRRFEKQANRFGYSLLKPHKTIELPWLGFQSHCAC